MKLFMYICMETCKIKVFHILWYLFAFLSFFVIQTIKKRNIYHIHLAETMKSYDILTFGEE